MRGEIIGGTDDGRWRAVRIYEGDASVRAEPFEAIEIDLAGSWSGPTRK